VAQHLERLGHEVIVADPSYAPMYAHRRRGVKTDRRDARALMEALQRGIYRAVHRASAIQRHVRAQLAVRDALIRTRSRYVNVVRALTRREGLRVPSGGPEHLERRLATLALDAPLTDELAPLRTVLEPVNAQIAQADAALSARAHLDPRVALLCTMPQIGPVTAVAFVATLDDVTRFRSAHQVQGYLGLTPREYSSGDRQQRGRISKTGNPRMRALLVETGWRVLRSRDPQLAPLRAWGEAIAQRRGTAIAAVALARRIAGMLYAMWRDDAPYRAPATRAVA
jgi:transposase